MHVCSVKSILCPTDNNLLFGNDITVSDSESTSHNEVFKFSFSVNKELAEEQEYITVGFGSLECYALVLFPSTDIEYIDPRMKSVTNDNGDECGEEWDVFTVEIPMTNMYECGFEQQNDLIENKVRYSNELVLVAGKTDTVQYFDIDVYTFETKKIGISIVYPMTVQSTLTETENYGEHLQFSYISSLIDMTSLPPSMILWIKTFTQYPYKVFNGTLYNENMTEIANTRDGNIMIFGECDTNSSSGDACEQTSTNKLALTPPLCGSNSRLYTYGMYFTCADKEEIACNLGDMSYGSVQFYVNPSACNEEATAESRAYLSAYSDLSLSEDKKYTSFVYNDVIYLSMDIEGLGGGNVDLQYVEITRNCDDTSTSTTPPCIETTYSVPIYGYEQSDGGLTPKNSQDGYVSIWKEFGTVSDTIGGDEYRDSIVFSVLVNEEFFPVFPRDNLPAKYTITTTALLNGFEERRRSLRFISQRVLTTDEETESSYDVYINDDGTVSCTNSVVSTSSSTSDFRISSIVLFVIGIVCLFFSILVVIIVRRVQTVSTVG